MILNFIENMILNDIKLHDLGCYKKNNKNIDNINIKFIISHQKFDNMNVFFFNC